MKDCCSVPRHALTVVMPVGTTEANVAEECHCVLAMRSKALPQGFTGYRRTRALSVYFRELWVQDLDHRGYSE